ncbi:hypothetical protein TNCV_198061 [Trichonephila clavipes]|nr:hypothetical protein TNCV_198061 [Trichonephila clavipes]
MRGRTLRHCFLEYFINWAPEKNALDIADGSFSFECHEFEPSTAEDQPCRGDNAICLGSDVLPLIWKLGERSVGSGVVLVT